MQRLKLAGLSLLIGLSAGMINPAFAGWYTASGSAAIENDDAAAARQAAVNDALRSIMLEAGADISTLQALSDGALTTERINIKSTSPIRKVSVIEEQRTLNAVTVKVRAFVDDDASRSSACALSAVKKTVLPLQFRFADNRAYQGAAGLDELPAEIGHLLFSELAQTAALQILPEGNFRFFVNEESSGASYEEQSALEQISERYDAQFVLVGSLRAAALSDTGDNFLEQLVYKKTRTIDFTVAVYHALSGAVLMRETYRGEADWDFRQGQYVDLRSEAFLSSPYGQRLKDLISDAADDVRQALTCLAPAARIAAVEGDSIIVNLGSADGLKEHMRFRLSHQSENYDRRQRRYRSYDRSESLYQVTAVFPHSARLAPVSLHESPLNVLIDDIVILETP